MLSEQWQNNLSSSGLISTTAFTYDYTGNRQSLTFSTNQSGNTSATTRYGYNNLDQLLVVTPTAGGPVINYTYDGRGNLAGMVDNTSGKSTSYNFDALDRLSTLTQTVGGGASVVTSNYRYDWGGRRIWQSISGSGVPSASQTSYLWDETSQYGDVVLETDASSGNPQVSYVLGGGELLSQDKVGVTSYYLKDGHGSVRSLSDGSGNLVAGEQYNYNAFGSLVSGPTNPASKYLYTGQQFDGQTGLYDLRARYYNPSDGRFLSQDMVSFVLNNPYELNRYIYAANNFVTWSDPSGLLVPSNDEQSILARVRQTVSDIAKRKIVRWVGISIVNALVEELLLLIANHQGVAISLSANIGSLKELIVNDDTFSHILRGGQGTNGYYGYHLRPSGVDSLNPNLRVKPGTINPKGHSTSEIYEASLEYFDSASNSWKDTGKSSTFFPDDMTPTDVANALQEAIQNLSLRGTMNGEIRRSFTWKGRTFDMRIDYEVGTNRVISAYPVR